MCPWHTICIGIAEDAVAVCIVCGHLTQYIDQVGQGRSDGGGFFDSGGADAVQGSLDRRGEPILPERS